MDLLNMMTSSTLEGCVRPSSLPTHILQLSSLRVPTVHIGVAGLLLKKGAIFLFLVVSDDFGRPQREASRVLPAILDIARAKHHSDESHVVVSTQPIVIKDTETAACCLRDASLNA